MLNAGSGAWKTAKLKPYNFEAMGAPPMSGALHPCMVDTAIYLPSSLPVLQ